MSDGFLSRWSRRKQAVARGVPDVVEPPAAEQLSAAGPPALELPAIETLGAGSDYSAFLQKGVAAVVQQAALQRAWTSDAGIAAFRGMADYDWDFNAASYGRLRATDSVAELLKGVLGSGVPEPEAAMVAEAGVVDGPSVRLSIAAGPVVDAPAAEDAGQLEATEVAALEPPAVPGGRHGSAMPS